MNKKNILIVAAIIILGLIIWQSWPSKPDLEPESSAPNSTATKPGATNSKPGTTPSPSSPQKPASSSVTPAKLNGQILRLVSYNGVATPADSKYTVSFDQESLSAKFCNSMQGVYILDSTLLTVRNLASTKMYCGAPENLMDIENAFGSMLGFGARISQTDNMLTMVDPKGNTFIFTGFGY